MSVNITASFISPVLKFSKEEIRFSTVLVRTYVVCLVVIVALSMIVILATW